MRLQKGGKFVVAAPVLVFKYTSYLGNSRIMKSWWDSSVEDDNQKQGGEPLDNESSIKRYLLQ